MKVDLTLVAYYAIKPREFSDLVNDLQHRLASLLGASFTPYEPQQVHSTIIGLEGWRDGNKVLNMNYLRSQHQRRYMDLEPLNEAINNALELLPLQIRFGGFRRFEHYPFTSRGQHPFARSFSIHDGIAVAMGWPSARNEFPLSLDRLRRNFNKANVLHKYHESKYDVDNDFFFVLGQVEYEDIDATSLEFAEKEMCNFLELLEPIQCELGGEHLSLVSYRDPTLPRNACKIYDVVDIGNRNAGLETQFRRYDPNR